MLLLCICCVADVGLLCGYCLFVCVDVVWLFFGCCMVVLLLMSGCCCVVIIGSLYGCCLLVHTRCGVPFGYCAVAVQLFCGFYVIVVCVFFLGGYLVVCFATAVVLLFYDLYVI